MSERQSRPSGSRTLRVVLDTNIVVSSLLSPSGVPARVMDAWRSMRILPVLSPPILQEIRATLSYPRIRVKYAISEKAIDELLNLLASDALMVGGEVSASGAVPDDPKDDMFLGCAIEGEADLVVSGDQHLLRLGTYRGIPIVSARRLLEELGLD